MEGLLTEEIIAVVSIALIVVASLCTAVVTVVIMQIVEEDIRNERDEKKNHK